MKLSSHQLFLSAFIGIALHATAQKTKPVTLTARIIDKHLAKVSDTLYAYRYETCNGEYNLFLAAIKNSNPNLYNSCLVDSTNWPLRYCEPMVNYYHRHPVFARYPVVNVSYEAANEYCKWLTGLYNSDPKREFKKVEFRLPTETEWMRAAEGGRSQAMFPWGKFYLRNKNGQHMCNYNSVNEMAIYRDDLGRPMIAVDSSNHSRFAGSLNDRIYYTVNVGSYYPNDYGIYNMSGNAAEMTIEKGLTKGGSWDSYGSEVTIRSVKIYKGSSPELGFRVFMKVIEKQ